MHARLYGYARVSTTDQSLDIQLAALRSAGVHEALIFKDVYTGKQVVGRVELQRVMALLGPGDILVVTRLDRLGRSIRDLMNLLHDMEGKKAHLRVLEQNVDTTTPAGRAFFGMLATFAQFETDLRAERQREGIARAKALGVYKGRPKSVDRDIVMRLYHEGRELSEIAKAARCNRSTAYRIITANGGSFGSAIEKARMNEIRAAARQPGGEA